MSMLRVFRTKWSSSEIKEDDRRKIFWYLKRKTSYTAWSREADIFGRFAAIFKRQVEEDPVAPGTMNSTNWEGFYPKVLKAEVLYKQALERLRQGDRTIFLRNSRGAMDDATVLP